jgi:threonine aldolase
MRRAIAEAEVGDAVLGDDPTAAELERHAAELLGKEAALFFPSGIMANQTRCWCRRAGDPGGDRGGRPHPELRGSRGGQPRRAQLRAVPTPDGLLTPEEVVAGAIRPDSRYLPRTSLVCLENTHNGAGRAGAAAERVRARSPRWRASAGGGAPGRRAAAERGRRGGPPLGTLAGPADTVMIALSKGSARRSARCWPGRPI